MAKPETMEKLKGIINEYKEVDSDTLSLNTTFEELELDSLDLVDMAMACEDAFGTTVEIDENLKTVGDLVAILEAEK